MRKKFVHYRLPLDVEPREPRLRHLMDYETMAKTIGRIENKQELADEEGQTDAPTV